MMNSMSIKLTEKIVIERTEDINMIDMPGVGTAQVNWGAIKRTVIGTKRSIGSQAMKGEKSKRLCVADTEGKIKGYINHTFKKDGQFKQDGFGVTDESERKIHDDFVEEWKNRVLDKAADKYHSQLGAEPSPMKLRDEIKDEEWAVVMKALSSNSAPGDDNLRNSDIADKRNTGLNTACRALVELILLMMFIPRYWRYGRAVPIQKLGKKVSIWSS